MLSILNKNRRVKVAVHNGKFHSDDVFAVAILSLYLKRSPKIFRTRDEKILNKMDYLLDVGMVYDPAQNKFDHHEEGWNKKRENGVVYAASGLLWKEVGEKICGSYDIAKKIDEKIIQVIDAEDNGISICTNIIEGVVPYSFSDYIFSLNPTWMEKRMSRIKAFEGAVKEAKKILTREIKKAYDSILGKEKIKEVYENTEDKRLIVLNDDYPWKRVMENFPETLFVVKPNGENKNWYLYAVNMKGEKFKARLDLPANWAGKVDEELVAATGVKDAVFCHNGRFVAVAKSRTGAIALAKLALENR